MIGKGGFGSVWKVKLKLNNEIFAAKVMSKAKIIAKRSEDNINSEKNILSKINHPFIVNMHFSFQDYDNLYLIMDYLSGGDLRYHLSHRRSSLFNEHQTKFFISNIIIALEYIHSKKIIHRDIKPENLLLDMKGYLRLTDFGIAVYNRKDNKKESNGTAGYVAPEVIMHQEYSYCSDFFALGVIGYEFMQGSRPYYIGNKKQIKDLIIVYQPKIKANQLKKGWSEKSRDFINKLLQRKPNKRLGYGGIKELKNHIWLKDVNWDLLKNKKIKSLFIPKEGKEYFDKKYCKNDKTIENNKLINVKGYQHVFKNYTFINSEYISRFIDNKEIYKKELNEKEINRTAKKTLNETKMKLNFLNNKNHSSSFLSLGNNDSFQNKKYKQNEKNENNEKNVIIKNKNDIKKNNSENNSFLINNNNNILYNSNNFLIRKYYDLGIPRKSKEKINKKNTKNNSCQLQNRIEKQIKKNFASIATKKFMNWFLINKFSKKSSLIKNKTNKLIFNKTLNNDNEQLAYSTTKKTTKEKTTNIMTDNQKKEETKSSKNKIKFNNNEEKHLLKNTNKKFNIKSAKKEFSKSQIIVNEKDKKKFFTNKDNKTIKNNIKINKNLFKNNKKYNSVSSRNTHLKSMSKLSKGKNILYRNNKKTDKTFNSTKKKENKKIEKIKSEEIGILNFDDYFENTGLIKDSTKNNYYILDKFKSL